MSVPGNGVAARFDGMQREVDGLWSTKASKESVQNLKEDVQAKASQESVDGLRKEVGQARMEIGGLRKVLIGASVAWAAGSGAFLIGVLQLTQ